MTAQAQWTQIEAALDEILALPESEWPEACARLSGNDDVLLAEINSLLEARQTARKAKDFKRSDAIRDELKAKGWVIEDSSKGPKLKKL